MQADYPGSTGIFVVGYALEPHAAALKQSQQPRKINQFCRQNGYNLIFTEQEVGRPKNLCRPGLWRVTRALVCYGCDPGEMPVAYDVEAWVQRALMACRCGDPTAVDGIVVASIGSLCSDAISGTKYALALAIARKHLFVVEEETCMSCCNPAAAVFMNRQNKP